MIIHVPERHRPVIVDHWRGHVAQILPVVKSHRVAFRSRIDRRTSQYVSRYVGHVVEYNARRGRVEVNFWSSSILLVVVVKQGIVSHMLLEARMILPVENLLDRPQRISALGGGGDVEYRRDEAEDGRRQREQASVEEDSDVPVYVPSSPREQSGHERDQTGDR